MIAGDAARGAREVDESRDSMALELMALVPERRPSESGYDPTGKPALLNPSGLTKGNTDGSI